MSNYYEREKKMENGEKTATVQLSESTLSHYQRHSKLWETSGMKQSEYCARHNLRLYTFSYVRGKLLKVKRTAEAKAKKRPAFIPVVSQAKCDTTQSEPPQKSHCRLYLRGGEILEWSSTVALSELQKLFSILGIGR